MADRENWSSRWAFIVAAIGSAIGFGNVWRFPSLAYQYGDGAFFIPYLLALFLIGIPVLILETSIGQYYQTGDAGAFGNINRRARGLGLASVLCSFVLNSYYSALMAWVVRMFVASCDGSDGKWRGQTAKAAYDWFRNEITGADTVAAGLVPTRIVWQNLLALLFVWLVVFLCLAFGVKWTGRVAYFTVGLPVLILFILVIRAATLEGAGDGIRKYIGGWDVKILSERGEVWSVAVSQIFFSIGVTLGIMTAYASYNKRNSPVFANATIISLSNSFFSFIAGFAVFGIVGYIAHEEMTTIENLDGVESGPALMFATFPVALSTLPGYGHWERLLFVALFMLGIDSAFSFVEAVTTVLHDSVMFHRAPRAALTGSVCVVGFLVGILYTTDAGFYFLDVTDFYINFMLLLVGFAECLVVGWAYGLDEQIRRVGAGPTYALAATSFGSVVTASGVWFGVAKNGGSQPDGWRIQDWSLMWGFITLFICVMVGLAVTLFLAWKAMCGGGPAQDLSRWEFFVELTMGNMWHLKRDLTGVVNYIPTPWFVLIKHFIPQVLLLLFVNLAASDAKNSADEVIGRQFGNYGGYNPGYQALGIVVFSASLAILVVGMVAPKLFKCFSIQTYQTENGTDEEDMGEVQ